MRARHTLRRVVGASLLLSSLLLVSCGGTDQASTDGECPDPSTAGVVTVFAASSMKYALAATKEQFLRGHPCATDLVVSYASSAVLAAQIVAGAPADAFVSASKASMDTVTNSSRNVGPAVVFARNSAEIMVWSGSDHAGRIATVADLFRKGIRTGLCVASAPCGALADTVLAKARATHGDPGLTRDRIASETASVEDLVTKIELGELDAGIVYRSDCRHEQPTVRATCVAIPDEINSTNEYLVAATSDRPVARQFAGFISSPSFGTHLQSAHGFLAP